MGVQFGSGKVAMHGCEYRFIIGWALVCICLSGALCVSVPLSRAGGAPADNTNDGFDSLDSLDSLVGAGASQPITGTDRLNTSAGALRGAPYLREDRYTLVRGAVRPDQRQPLNAAVHIAFGDNIRTIGQAVVELLSRSGYRLAHSDQANCLLVRELLFRQPLPAPLRDLGPLPLLDGLGALVGIAWGVHVNELGRSLQLRVHPEYRDERWIERFLEEQSSVAVTSGQHWFVPFALAEFRTLSDVARRVIQQATDAAHTQEAQLMVRGHSHSYASWATQEQAHRRVQTVAAALEVGGVQRSQIVVETSVSNHQDPSTVLRHGVDIELRDPQVVDRVAACHQLPAAVLRADEVALSPGDFTVRRGSLKTNVERLLERFSLRVGQWRLTDGDYEYDWDIPYEYQVSAPDAEQALRALLESYDIQPTLNSRDRTVDFAPRYTPRRAGVAE